jgi:hypothetical protein
MKTIFFLSVYFLALISCKQSVILSVQYHQPHCGGAPPEPGQEGGTFYPYMGTVLLKSNQDSLLISTRFSGVNVKLRKGDYSWYKANKLESAESIYQGLLGLNQEFYIPSDLECVKLWKTQPDGAFVINKNSDTIILINRMDCYTKDFPCVKYIGPKYQ